LRGNYRAPKRNGKYRAYKYKRPKSPLVTHRIAGIAALAAVAVVGTLSADSLSASARTRPPIMVSANPDRSAADNLAGSTKSGLAYIFVATSLPIDAVSFVLDQGTDEAQRLTDDTAPYDLAGTAPDGTANPLDLTALADGSHKVVARLVDASGRTLARTSAAFSVVRPTQPEPTSTPTSTSTPTPTSTSTPTPTSTATPTSTSTPTPTSTTAPFDGVVINAAPGGIAAALTKVRDVNRQGKAVKLVLQPTIYRESLVLGPDGMATTAPIIIDGQGAVISGANVLASWSPVGDGTFRHYWPHNLGNSADPWPSLSYNRVVLNREAMFVGQMPYHVVDSAAKLVPGTFLVDEAANTITARPRTGDAPLTSAEVTARMKTLQIDGRTNVTVRNLTVERGAGAVQENMAGSWDSSNVTVENVTVRQAAGGGIAIGKGKNATLRNVRFLDNGIVGYSSYKQNGITIENAELARNNWRGAQVGFVGWAAGVKFAMSSNVTINGWNAHHNHSHGLWFDYDNENISVYGLVSAGNLGRGISLEKNPGPITIDNARICNNGMSGISYARTDRATVRNSQVFNNAGWQHMHTGSSTPVTMPDGYVVYGNSMTLQNTITVGDDWAQKDSLNKGWLFWQTRDEAAFWNSASFSGNTWYHTQRTDPFRVNSTWDDWLDYAAFAAKVHETNGRWANPGTLSCPAARPAQTVDYAVSW
jgi:Right handed beta helix region